MHRYAVLAGFTLFFALACSRAPLEPEALCIGPAVKAQGAIFTTSGPAAASEAGEVVAVVQRQRTCEDVIITVTDSARAASVQPWLDGDADGFAVGTVLHQRLGSQPGQELVAQGGRGEWVLLRRSPGP